MNTHTWKMFLVNEFEFNTSTYTSNESTGIRNVFIPARMVVCFGWDFAMRLGILEGCPGPGDPGVLGDLHVPQLPRPLHRSVWGQMVVVTIFATSRGATEPLWSGWPPPPNPTHLNPIWTPFLHRVLQGAAQRGTQFYFMLRFSGPFLRAAKWVFEDLKTCTPVRATPWSTAWFLTLFRPEFDPILTPNGRKRSELGQIQFKIGSERGPNRVGVTGIWGWGSSRPEWLCSSFEKLQHYIEDHPHPQ